MTDEIKKLKLIPPTDARVNHAIAPFIDEMLKDEGYKDRKELVSSVTKILASDLIASIKDRKNIMFSVPGGSTPGPIFDKLCEFDLDWKRVSIILNDERWVSESNERSNTKLLRERLLIKKATLASYISLYSDTITPELGIPTLKKRIEPNLPISVLLFGMGTDMHTA